MASSPRADAHPALLETWFDQLDQLTRRRGDNRAAIAAHVETFLAALKDWEASTGERAARYRALMAERIDRALGAPWPTTAARREKLAHARKLIVG